jgi:hypothetical protein
MTTEREDHPGESRAAGALQQLGNISQACKTMRCSRDSPRQSKESIACSQRDGHLLMFLRDRLGWHGRAAMSRALSAFTN